MFGSGILDTAIGLIFVFLLVSILVTTANELFSAIVLSRAKWLEFGIQRLIGSKWARQLYEHPLIEGSTKGWKPADDKAPEGDDDKAKLRLRGAGPSYIPSRAFANILMELLQGAGKMLRETESVLQKALEVASAGANSVKDIKAAVDGLAAALPANLPANLKAAIAADLAQLSAILDKNAAGRLAGWLADLEGHTRTLSETALPEAKAALAALVVGARTGSLGLPEIRQEMIAAMNKLPVGAAGDMARADLNMVLTRLEAGYTVGDAIGEVQRFIRGVPAGYVRQLILNLPDTDKRMRDSLLTLYDDAANDVEKFKQNIEVWFNNAMDRVAGWYKRRAQTVTFGISALVVVLMNVDALLIVRYLDANHGVRDNLVSQAQAYVDTKAKDTTPPKPGWAAGDVVTGKMPIDAKAGEEIVFWTDVKGAVFRPPSVTPDKAVTEIDYALDTPIGDQAKTVTVKAKIGDVEKATASIDLQPSYPAQLRHLQKQLMDLKLPIGWSRNPNQADSDMRLGLPGWFDFAAYWDRFSFHFFGWLITAIAATLGAPFWFDILNKIMSIRSAGKAPEEKSKSPEVVQAPMAPGQSPGEASRLAAIAQSGH